jgi:hypothetical protein
LTALTGEMGDEASLVVRVRNYVETMATSVNDEANDNGAKAIVVALMVVVVALLLAYAEK